MFFPHHGKRARAFRGMFPLRRLRCAFAKSPPSVALFCLASAEGIESEEDEGGADEEGGPLGGFAEKQEGNGDAERDFQIVHDGQRTGGNLTRATVPKEKADAGGDEAKINENAPLFGGGRGRVVAERERQGQRSQHRHAAEVQPEEDVAVGQGARQSRENGAVGELAGGEAKVGDLHEQNAPKGRGGFKLGPSNPGGAGDGEQGGDEVAEMEAALGCVIQDRDKKGRQNGEERDFVGLQPMEAGHVGPVHQAKLNRAGDEKTDGAAPRDAADKRQKDGGAERQPHPCQPARRQIAETIANQAKRKRPKERNCRE